MATFPRFVTRAPELAGHLLQSLSYSRWDDDDDVDDDDDYGNLWYCSFDGKKRQGVAGRSGVLCAVRVSSGAADLHFFTTIHTFNMGKHILAFRDVSVSIPCEVSVVCYGNDFGNLRAEPMGPSRLSIRI
jgi:hypothetical protein